MPYKLKDPGNLCESLNVIINWLIQLNLIIDLKDCVCKFCNFGLRKDTSFSRDCYVWKCSNKKCHLNVSIRNGSWFENHNLT